MCTITKGDRRKQSTSLTDSTGELGWEKVTEAFNPPRERVDPCFHQGAFKNYVDRMGRVGGQLNVYEIK